LDLAPQHNSLNLGCGFAGVVGYGLFEVGLEFGFDERNGVVGGVAGDFNREGAVGVGVVGGDSVFVEGAGGAVEFDAVGAEARGERGELGVGDGYLNHRE
jgi:hypothetical protein